MAEGSEEGCGEEEVLRPGERQRCEEREGSVEEGEATEQ